jgi:outer membrane protein OmpA-like peptidoglycan-associated protein
MRCDRRTWTWLVVVGGLASGCATPNAGKVCTQVDSWASPVYECVAAAPPPAPAPPPPAPEPEPAPAPPPKKAEIKAEKIELKETIEFELNSTTLVKKSTPVLDDVVQIMKDHPEITKIEVQGHTDSQGPRAHNVKLSTGRAAAVRKYLVDHGIEAGRIVSKGYGPDKPIADNKTEDGRAQNRRVEIHILERKPGS